MKVPMYLLGSVLVIFIYSAMFALRSTLTGGAYGDLIDFHIPSIEIYKLNNLLDAMRLQNSAMRPL